MMSIVYIAVLSTLWDREILFDVLFTFVIMAMLLGLANESVVPATGKVQLTEALSLAKALQMDLMNYRAETGRWPERQELNPGNKYLPRAEIVQSITTDQGSIVFAFAETAGALSGKKLMFRAGERRGVIGTPVLWLCGYARAPEQFNVRNENLTDVPRELLPEACRS